MKKQNNIKRYSILFILVVIVLILAVTIIFNYFKLNEENDVFHNIYDVIVRNNSCEAFVTNTDGTKTNLRTYDADYDDYYFSIDDLNVRIGDKIINYDISYNTSSDINFISRLPFYYEGKSITIMIELIEEQDVDDGLAEYYLVYEFDANETYFIKYYFTDKDIVSVVIDNPDQNLIEIFDAIIEDVNNRFKTC